MLFRSSPNDVIYQYFPDGTRVQISSWYPYGSFIPAPGGIVTALVSWNGTAYDLSSMPSSTRLIFTLEDLLKNPSRR